LASKHPNRKHW